MSAWTEAHAKYLENQIKRLKREQDETDDPAAIEVLHACHIALINLRRPVDKNGGEL